MIAQLRAEYTKEIVTPALGISGVGGAMAVYGAADAVVCYLINMNSYYLFIFSFL